MILMAGAMWLTSTTGWLLCLPIPAIGKALGC